MLAAHVLLAFQIVCSCHLITPVSCRSCELADLGSGDRPAMCRDHRCCSTALQRVRGTRRRTLVLVAQLLFSQVPKFSFTTFGPTRLLPKLIRSRVDFPFAGFSQYVFSGLEHGPAMLGTYRRDVPDQLRDWPFDSSPHEAVGSSRPRKTKAMRALHRMAFAGTVPLLARIPFPVTAPLTGRNVPADAHLPRTASAALTMLMVGFFPQ